MKKPTRAAASRRPTVKAPGKRLPARPTAWRAADSVLLAGWIRSGDSTAAACRIDLVPLPGGRALRLSGSARNVGSFGTAMQQFAAQDYRGQRVRLAAELRCHRIDDWAGLWMRVNEGRNMVAFDNMQHRPLTGTSDWTAHAVVLNVSPAADRISMGVLLAGTGTVEVRNFRFEVVDSTVITTDHMSHLPLKPVNLQLDDRPIE